MPRIVSLLPSATEIVSALGYGDSLVGRSHECDFPAGVERLPICTAPKVGGADTRAIHTSVSTMLQSDISVYSVDADLLRELQPTHIVTQIQCDVCAVSLRDVEAALASWPVAPQIVALNPQSLADVYEDIRRTAMALGGDAEPLIASMQARFRDIAGRAQSNVKPRVATIEWMEPLMTAGNWMPELIETAGGVDILGKAGRHSDWITWNDLVVADPDIIVVIPCGFGLEEIRRDWHYLSSHAESRSLRASVFMADGNQYFNRPGPRLVESAEILAEIFRKARARNVLP